MSKRLLVTSDDFGMCHSVNVGIARAMTEGIVRSTNFLVPCPWFVHALELAKRHQLLVGVHLCLTCDWDLYRWGPITRAESLTDEHGYFLPSHAAVAKQAKESDIHDELLAQIKRVKAMGYEPTHLDTHMTGSGSTGPYFDMVKGIILCQTETSGPVPVAGCLPISCTVSEAVPPGSTITMVVNDAGRGQRVTDECHYENNTSSVLIDRCAVIN